MRTQDEVKEILSEIRQEIILATNRRDIVAYMYFMQELHIGAAMLEDEDDRKELGIFVFNIEKTYRESKALFEKSRGA